MSIRRRRPLVTLTFGFLFLIITGGAIIRIYNLAGNPAGFFADEAAIGYNAYKLLTTGADEYGVPFPFFFRSFGDYRNPLPIYLNIPTVALLGLNELTVRLTAALAGTLTILFVFFITREGSPWSEPAWRNGFALVSALFLAITPWHIHFSRFGSEYIYFPFLLSLGWVLFLLAQNIPWLLPVSFGVFGTTLYTYYPTWLVTPLFVVLLLVVYRRWLFSHWKETLLSLALFGLSTTPLIWGVARGIALTRWNNVAITKDKPASLPLLFAKNYVSHFSPTFLFTKGDIDYPGHFIRRFSSRGTGELYLFWLPLILLGVGMAIVKRRPFLLSLLGLLLLYPLGGTFANTDGGAPLAFRSIIGVLPFPILAALGTVVLVRCFQSRFIQVLVVVLFLVLSGTSLNFYLAEYHTQYPLYSSDFWGWQFGPRDVMTYFLAHRTEYDEMYLMGNFNSPEIFLKFYDPANSCHSRCLIGGIERYDSRKKQLFAIGTERLGELPTYLTARVVHTIYYPDYRPAFLLARLLTH